MRNALIPVLLSAAALFVPATAGAQMGPQAAEAAADQLVAPANLTLGAVGGVSRDASNTGRLAPSVEFVLDATAENKVGTVGIGWRNGQGQFRLAVSAPLDSGGEAEPISLLGLPSGGKVTLAFNRLNWRGPTPLEQLHALELCTKTLKAMNRTAGRPEEPIELADCDVRKGKLPLTEAAALRQLYHLDDRIWLFGLDASIERATFNYLASGTLQPGKEAHEAVAGTARIGHFLGPYGFLFASYSYRHAHRAGSAPTEVCRPIAGTDSLRCDQAVLGKPSPTTMQVATVEVRKFFAKRAAFNPSVQYDFENDITAIDVPIYFIKNAGGTPTGGVRLSWRSDTKQVLASVFVGGALSLLP